MKNRVLLEHYYLPGDIKTHLDAFVVHDIYRRYNYGPVNVTPADVYFGRAETVLKKRAAIK